MIRRRQSLYIPIGPLLFAMLFLSATCLAEQPNVLFIYVDDLGYGDLGSYGHPVIQTPNIDALAHEGMTFTNYYAPSALCSPSRAGVLTGRSPYRTGIKSWIPKDSGVFLRDEEITLAEVLKAEGYATALIGKWHLNSDLGSTVEPQPTDQGFGYFYGHNTFQTPTNRNPDKIYRDRELLPPQEGYTAQLYADEAIDWLRSQDNGQPFFLFLSMAEPHTPIENPREYNELYSQYTNGPIVPIQSGLLKIPVEKLTPRGPGEYYANITYMDAQLGRVLHWLERSNLADNTIVIFTSDNGPVTSDWLHWWEVNAYGSTGGYRGRKHLLYEGGIKVPAIIRYPDVVEPGSTSDELLVGTDLFVTLAHLGGGTVPDDRPIDGVDVRAVLSGGELPQRTVFWALDSVSDLEFVVRSGDWKLFIDRDGNPRELYDLAVDPLEFFDVSENKPSVVSDLMSQFETQDYLQNQKREDE
ncbi:MAG: sulfatase family protein [Woeseiaceae bacterium]